MSYHDCEQFYFLEVETFLRTKKLFADITIPLEMSELEVQDIDTDEDWKVAEMKYAYSGNKDRFLLNRTYFGKKYCNRFKIEFN